MEIKSVCIYCASSSNINKKYFEAANRLAEILVENNIQVIFGGGAVGLMGSVADTVLRLDGEIIGIMPNFMKEIELQHKGVKNYMFVGGMHERKKKFLEHSDALITLPGGCGTFEELMEAITLKRLGIINKPIIILNTNNYYESLIEMLNKSIQEGFLKEDHNNLWSVVDLPEEVLPAIKNAPEWDLTRAMGNI
ncbi:LOG family protein [Peijinzhouia sedimentorum]